MAMAADPRGAVRLVMDVRGNIAGKHVLIVEDIVDTGHTLKYLIGMLESHLPASVKTCALVRKAERAEVDVDVDYLGFDIRRRMGRGLRPRLRGTEPHVAIHRGHQARRPVTVP